MNFDHIMDNPSIFKNKKLEGVGIKKRRSEVDLDSECLDA